VEGAWSRHGGGGCSGVGVLNHCGHGRCMASGPDLGLKWAMAPAREATSLALRPCWLCQTAWGSSSKPMLASGDAVGGQRPSSTLVFSSPSAVVAQVGSFILAPSPLVG
jgi:hypothetical protein